MSEPGGEPTGRADERVALSGGKLRGFVERAVAEVRDGARELAAQLGRRRLLAIGLLLLLLASPWPPLTVAALAAYVVVAFKLPGLTTALLPLAFPFAYQPKSLFGPEFPVVELLLLVGLATSGVQLLAVWRRTAHAGTGSAAILDLWDEAKRVLGGSFGQQAAALALIATFSLFTVADPAHLRESLREYRTVIIEPLLYFFLARHWLRARELRQIAIGAFVGGAALVGLLAIGQVASGQGVVATEGVRRALGTYNHPNALALYLLRATAFATALAVLSGVPRQARALRLCLPIIGVALLLTFSRGAFLGLVVALAVLLLFVGWRNARGGILAVGIAAVALIALALAGFAVVRGGGDSLGLRQLIWRSALAIIRDHPAFGVGLDQFLTQYSPRYIQPAAWDERFTSHPHNLFLDFWVRLGIMGFAWVAWTLISLVSSLARAWRLAAPAPPPTPPPRGRGAKGRQPLAATSEAVAASAEARALLIAAGVACIAAFTHGLLDNFYFLIDLAFAWWLLLALAQIGAGDAAGAAEPVEGW